MKIITNHFCNYNTLDLLTKCHSTCMLIILIFKKKQHCPVYSKRVLYTCKGKNFR